jgi:hypothetical protein
MSEEYVEEEEIVEEPVSMGGKRKSKRHGNASLTAWVAFVKKVQKEENLSYRDAMMRAKVRKDKGEKWMKGGMKAGVKSGVTFSESLSPQIMKGGMMSTLSPAGINQTMSGGRRRRRSHKRRGSKKRRHTRRHSRRH